MFTILHTESSIGWGGQEIRILCESIGMIKRGYQVIIAAPEGSNIFKRAKDLGITTFSVKFSKKNPLSIFQIKELINREKVDILNTHSSSDSWVATIAAKFAKVKPKIIRTRHLSTPISRSFLSRILYDVLPDAIITTGEEIRQRMINDNGFDASKIFSIPTGVDLERFNPTEVKPLFQSNGFSIGMIGVLRRWKGHKYFIEAVPLILKSIPDAFFYIIGDGPQYKNIKALINSLSLNDKVFILGHREDIPQLLASMDVIVHPSYANEGIPQSILQSMAMEKPVVASNVGAIKEVVINGKTGFLIEPKNMAQLAEKVVELCKATGLRTKFGKEGGSLVEKEYAIEKMLDKIESLYKRLLKDKSEKHKF